MVLLMFKPFLLYFFAFSVFFSHARSQPGFTSIDCGLPLESTDYNDTQTGLIYSSDHHFNVKIRGVNSTVDANYIDHSVARHLQTVRYFPLVQGGRSCYDFASLLPANKRYLIRATFRYGNYDGKNQPPTFHLYLGVDFWDTVEINNSTSVFTKEIIHVSRSNYLYVCLVNSGAGTPFISALELRLLNPGAYKTEKAGESLALFNRWNFAPADPNKVLRYPDDQYDRLWFPYTSPDDWISLNTTLSIGADDFYGPPQTAIQSAIAPRDPKGSIQISWDAPDRKSQFYVYLHIAEVVKLRSDEYRRIYIYLNDIWWWDQAPIPRYLSLHSIFSAHGERGATVHYNLSLAKAENSTLPPIINALEVYMVKQMMQSLTDENDVAAILNIKSAYGVERDWQGDPCLPKAFIWDGLDCIISGGDMSIPPRITSMNFSSYGLHGTVSSYFSKLNFLENLDLSDNNLSGSIPDFLADLPQLKVLILSGNNFSGSIPQKLLDKANNGGLQLRADGSMPGTPDKCEGNMCKDHRKSNKLAIKIGASLIGIVLVIIILVVIWWLKYKKKKRFSVTKNERFTYSDIVKMTNNFQMVLGRGGSGTVYCGLKDGKMVAVKLLTENELAFTLFETEAQLLARVHHRNITRLVGYCYEKSKKALVYEYMAKGSLTEHILESSEAKGNVLSWSVRLQIALNAAQGLNYLHNGCKPPIVHRDVKPANILLNENFEAKLSDFGFSRAFATIDGSSVRTKVIITTGYADPEYTATGNLHPKSDTYSLGIVMLQLITGRPAIDHNQENLLNVVKSLQQNVDTGSINIPDPKLKEAYDVSSLWSALELAMACASLTSVDRPTMDRVVAELEVCLAGEKARIGGGRGEVETVPLIDQVNSETLEPEIEP